VFDYYLADAFDVRLYDRVQISSNNQPVSGLLNVYSREELEELRGLGKELYPRAIYHGYSTKKGMSRKVIYSFL
jgi:hypothetical protein